MPTLTSTDNVLVDRALVDAARTVIAAYDHNDGLVPAVLVLLDSATTRLERRVAAQLYGLAVRPGKHEPVKLLDLVRHRAEQIENGDEQEHEPDHCFVGADGYCTSCRLASEKLLADALDMLKRDLGDQAARDLRGAVAA